MPLACGIRFRESGKIYDFSQGDLEDVQVDDYVLVETSRGEELGKVVSGAREISPSEVHGELKPVLRKATPLDLLEAERLRCEEEEAVDVCQQEADKLSLEMKVVAAEFSYDGSRLTFFFTAEQRVDFRQLVRNLARIFRTRIELRQIGVRDEAKMIGGLGPCGRVLCCRQWLSEFSPVSIRMAKSQDLPLSPMEISGLCGRLRCCLLYENDLYRRIKRKLPKRGRVVDTPYGRAKVLRVSVPKETVSLELKDGSRVELSAEELSDSHSRSKDGSKN